MMMMMVVLVCCLLLFFGLFGKERVVFDRQKSGTEEKNNGNQR